MIIDLTNEYFDPEGENDLFKILKKVYPDSNGHVTGYLSNSKLNDVDHKFILRKGEYSRGVYTIFDTQNEIIGSIEICNSWLRSRFKSIPNELFYYEQFRWYDIIQMSNRLPLVMVVCGRFSKSLNREKYTAYINLCLDEDRYLLRKEWGNCHENRIEEINGMKYYHANYKVIHAFFSDHLLEKINEEIRFLQDNVICMDDYGKICEEQEQSAFHVMILNQAGNTIYNVR
ncbi:MAG: hypothetical protein ONB11_12075 [candidate division KSB1 bacterium]|nr:hypothetical protein [candidate division KSB1 bacterium]